MASASDIPDQPMQRMVKAVPNNGRGSQPSAVPTAAAVDRRLRRVFTPHADGTAKVSESIRKMWVDLSQRDKVIKLFSECNFDTDRVLI